MGEAGLVCQWRPTAAAVGFAALLVVVLRSDEVRGLLLSLVTRALAMPA